MNSINSSLLDKHNMTEKMLIFMLFQIVNFSNAIFLEIFNETKAYELYVKSLNNEQVGKQDKKKNNF